MDIQPWTIAAVGLAGGAIAALVGVVWRLSNTLAKLDALEQKIKQLENEADQRNREEFARWFELNHTLGSVSARLPPGPPLRRSRP